MPDLARDYFLFFQKILLAMADKYCIMKVQEKREEKKERMKMKTWLVFNSKMDVVGSVRAEGYTEAFMIAQNRFRYVEYIQEV